MKIAITTSQITPGGGLTNYICTIAKFLSENKENEVYLISTHLSENNVFITNLVNEGRVKYVSLGKKGTLQKYVSLISVLRKFNPDALLVNYNATTQYILPFLSSRTKVFHIMHSYTDDFYRVATINARYVTRWIVPAQGLIAHFNEHTQNRYKERVHAIPHGVQLPLCEPVKNPVCSQLTYVGVLAEHKGVQILPDIIRQLYQQGFRFHFTFIGEGNMRSELEQALSEYIEKGVVEFTGRLSSAEVYKRLSQSDLFVYPTHLDSFGLVIAEAMINGAIPVATHLKGITDTIVDEGKNGYLVPMDDKAAFVHRIATLLQDGALRTQMSTSAIEKAISCFSVETMKANYLNYLKSLLNKNVR